MSVMKGKRIIVVICCVLVTGMLAYCLYPDEGLPPGKTVDKIVVMKSRRELIVYANGSILKTYKIALGGQPSGAKQYEGDMKTPEGIYYVNDKNPESKYHKNLGISYPNERDIENARLVGRSPGGDIKIHGLQNGIGFIGRLQAKADWTAGCMALTNQEIDDLYAHTPVGTVVEIRP
jgi:murein L,D-transpeptidase YafK